MSIQHLHPTASANQRRSQRVLLSVPLRVTGKREDQTAFAEHTNTVIVNAHGALIQLREAVQVGQMLNLKNIATGEDESCNVMDVNEGQNGVPEVGVEFRKPNPRFWRVSFPPADWSSRSPEAKRYATSPSPAATPSKVPVVKK